MRQSFQLDKYKIRKCIAAEILRGRNHFFCYNLCSEIEFTKKYQDRSHMTKLHIQLAVWKSERVQPCLA